MDIGNWTLKKWLLSHLILLGLLFLTLWQAFFVTQNHLFFSFLDVSQGDAILIQTPEYRNILIDAGEDSRIIEELSGQMGFFDKTIDLFILTHPHRDHLGGILEILQKYKVRSVMLTGVKAGDPLYKEFLAEIKAAGIQIIFPDAENDLKISKTAFLDIIYPFSGQSLMGQEVKNLNNTSIIIRLTRADGAPLALLTGDAEQEEEREVLLAGQNVSAPILKLGHHGSRTATSDIFLNAVKPKQAIISAGKDNKFSHPHPETLEKIKNLKVHQTMEEGDITFEF